MQIFLVRHGETEWNRQRRKQGRGDSPLTGRGRRQARAYGTVLARELPRQGSIHLVSSPMGRARHTAELLRHRLADRITSPRVVDALAEHDFGCWEGLTNREIEERYPGELERRRQLHWDYCVRGGESYARVADRVGAWIAELEPKSVTIAVTHDIVSRVLRSLYLSYSPEECRRLSHPQDRIFHLANGSLRSIDVDVDAAGPVLT